MMKIAGLDNLNRRTKMSNLMTVEYPETLPDTLHMSRAEFEREARLAMAVKLFETGKLTSGQAAHLASMTKVEFLYELGRFCISPIQMEVDELEADVHSAICASEKHRQH